MSRMSRRILRSLKELDGSLSLWDDVVEWFDITIERIKGNWWYNLKNFFRNAPLFLKLAWSWRSWDSSFTIAVLVRLLRANGDACKDGHLKNSGRMYKKAHLMAWKLERAYEYNITHDKAYMYIARKYPTKLESRQLVRGYKKGSVADKMHDVAIERIENLEVQLKKEAWEYINKHIDSIWD